MCARTSFAAPALARLALALLVAQGALVACSGGRDDAGEARSAIAGASTVRTSPAGFAIRAAVGARIHEGATVAGGDVGVVSPPGAGQGPSLRLDSRGEARGGTRLIAPAVLLSRNAVAGDVFADRVEDRGSTRGAVHPFIAVPAVEPLAASEAGTIDVTVSSGPAVELAAGRYGDVSIENGAVLRLTGGAYELASLRIASGGSMVALSRASVRLAGSLDSRRDSRIGVADGAGSAKDLRIDVGGGDPSPEGADPAAVRLGEWSVVRALISAPAGTIIVGANAAVTGALVASAVILRPHASVVFEDGFPDPTCGGGCDDANACTLDACVEGACRHDPLAGASCSDGNACNGEETCDGHGACVAGTPPAIDDGNPCTADGCDPAAGVSHPPVAAGTPCPDADLCDGQEACDGQGACVAGTPPAVDDGNPCTADACDPALGAVHAALPPGTSCSDADACNGAETCDGAGTCLTAPPLPLDDGDPCTADACDPATGVSHTAVAGCPAPPPGPTFAEQTAHLYSGDAPVQTGVQPGAIEPDRVSVVRGSVFERGGGPMGGVRLSVFDHPELGQTLTRDDGTFELAVNGGGAVVLEYAMSGYPGVHRTIDVPPNEYASAPDVALVPYDVSFAGVLGGAPWAQVARGSPVDDASGHRQATLVFQAGTMASMTLPDGSLVPVMMSQVRATEYTVGPDASIAMPAELSPAALTVYAVELSVDEALLAGAQEVGFEPPPALYLENYLGLPTGAPVAAARYDRSIAAWLPEAAGRVLTIVGITGGIADVDADGDGAADDGAWLASLGITETERERLAAFYVPGQSLWRVAVTRFGPLHCGAPY